LHINYLAIHGVGETATTSDDQSKSAMRKTQTGHYYWAQGATLIVCDSRSVYLLFSK
jgi:hypothetical protein